MTSRRFSLPVTWWRRLSSRFPPQNLTKLSILRTTPRYPSSALPFDTPTSFSARRSTHGKNMAVWTGECLPDRQPGRLWRADSLSSHFYRYIAKIGWNEVAILSLYVGFTYRGRNVLAHGSVCIFSLPFFCLSIIFVQPYAGFVCQKEQGPTVTAYQWWALPPFPFLPLHPQDREERSRYPVSEKMDRTLRGCLTMCLSFTLSYHPALGWDAAVIIMGAGNVIAKTIEVASGEIYSSATENYRSMEGTDGYRFSCYLSPNISHTLTNVVNGGPVYSHVATRRMLQEECHFSSGLGKMIQPHRRHPSLGKYELNPYPSPVLFPNLTPQGRQGQGCK